MNCNFTYTQNSTMNNTNDFIVGQVTVDMTLKSIVPIKQDGMGLKLHIERAFMSFEPFGRSHMYEFGRPSGV